MDDELRALWLSVRQALLMFVDAIERYLHICPRTAEIKREHSRQNHTQDIVREIERLGRSK